MYMYIHKQGLAIAYPVESKLLLPLEGIPALTVGFQEPLDDISSVDLHSRALHTVSANQCKLYCSMSAYEPRLSRVPQV